jgi:hypothetical protein
VGLLCAFGWWTLGLNIGTLLSISIGLDLGSVLKKYRWEPEKTSIDDLMGKATPVELHGLPKGVVRLRFDWIVPLKECFDFPVIPTLRSA